MHVTETWLLKYDDAYSLTYPVYNEHPNKFHLYNMIGNVAEMINEKGISTGEEWYHSIEDCEIEKSILYIQPESWLGFRSICVVLK